MKPWIRLPTELLQRQGIKKSAAIVLSAIIDRCTDSPTGAATIARSYLVQTTGYKLTVIREALRELEARGLIAHERTGRASVYRLTGCADLLPPKQRTGSAGNASGSANSRHRSGKKQLTQHLTDTELNEYLELSTCFDNIEDEQKGGEADAETQDPHKQRGEKPLER